MRKLLLSFLIVVSCSDSDQYLWFQGTLDEAISLLDKHPNKLVFLDFYSDGWGSCVRLDVETLSDPKVKEFSKQNFISLKLKPWKDKKASKLFDDYMGEGIPLLIFINKDGDEVDRILGKMEKRFLFFP